MEFRSVASSAVPAFPIAWVGIALVSLLGLGLLAFLIEAIVVTYQMLRGLKPDVRRGALLGAVSIVGDSLVENYLLGNTEGVSDCSGDAGCDGAGD